MDGKMYDSKIGEWKGLECGFGGVSIKKKLLGSFHDPGHARHFLWASGQVRECDGIHTKEISGYVLLWRCADTGIGSHDGGSGVNHISDAQKTHRFPSSRASVP